MLNLLLGRSGSGKSHYLRELSGKYIDSGKPVLVLVPEQFSFETGLYFLDRDSRALKENIKVLSFSSMIKYVFSKTGGLSGDFLDEGTSKILMSIAIEICQDNLKLYQKQVKNRNFVSLMLSAINEYKSNCISSDDLLSVKGIAENSTLKQKLDETSLILDTYNALVSERYLHNQDILSKLAEVIESEGIFRGFTVFIDAFTGFTGQQYRVLHAILSQADDVYITLSSECCKNKIDEKSIRFRVTTDTYHKLRALAKQCDTKVNEIYKPFCENRRSEKADIKAIEKNLYAFPQESFNGATENVRLYSALNIYSECEYVAAEVKRLTSQEGYRYKEIAVVCRDENMYRGILDITFDKFGIAYFMDNPENINSKPLINFIRHSFDAVNGSYNSESILRILKTGITKYEYEDISVIENYIFTWSPKWSEPFDRNINGIGSKEMTQQEKEALERAEEIRQEVFSYLKEFKENTEQGSGLEISKQILKLINNFGVKEKIESKIKRLTLREAPELVDDYTRVWNSVASVVSKMSVILENNYMTGKRYHELFMLAINSERIANQPLSIDSVIIGTAGRARLGSPKITFIIGAVQGVFPAIPSANGIFTDSERQLLLSMGLPMSCGLSDLSAQEQYSAYSSLASASERLYISYYTNTIDGGGAIPSTIVTQVQKILPDIKTEYQFDMYDLKQDRLWCRQQAFEHTVANIGINSPESMTMQNYFSKSEEYGDLLKSINSYIKKETPKLNPDTAHMLYSENMHLSASRIEDFYSCGYMYFCKNGLKLKERRKAKIDNRNYGSLVHYIMEKFLRQDNLEDIIQNTEKYDIEKIVREFTLEFIALSFSGGKIPDNKTEYTFKRAEKNCIVLVKRLIEELKVSDFRPNDFELSIGIAKNENSEADIHNVIDEYSVKTRDGKVSVVGFVDRVDLYKSSEDGKTYVRIVDYKTGNKVLKRCELEMGLSLQMFIYLSAIMKNGEALYGGNLAPAGVCYMPAKEFSALLSEYGKNDENADKIKKAFNKHYRANGLFLRNIDVIAAMDKNMNGQFIPVTIGVKRGKKKSEEPELEFKRSDNYLIDGSQYEGEFKAVFDLVDDKIRQMSDMLLDGYISSVPTGTKSEISNLPCSYCNYKNACRFEEGMQINEIPSAEKGEEGEDENG